MLSLSDFTLLLRDLQQKSKNHRNVQDHGLNYNFCCITSTCVAMPYFDAVLFLFYLVASSSSIFSGFDLVLIFIALSTFVNFSNKGQGDGFLSFIKVHFPNLHKIDGLNSPKLTVCIYFFFFFVYQPSYFLLRRC